MTSVNGDGGDALERIRADVVGRLHERRAEIDEVIFTRVRDVAPAAVGLGDAEYLAGLRGAVTAAVEFVLDGLEWSEEPDRSEIGQRIPAAVLGQARRAARVGVGLDTVLRRYVAGLAILEDFVMQETEHGEKDWIAPAERTALRRMMEVAASLLDQLILSVTGAYTQELAGAGGLPSPSTHTPSADVEEQDSYRTQSATIRREHQRARITQALVEVLAERGFAGITVGLVITRARVSTRTFYQCFDGLEECLIAIMDTVLERAVTLASRELEEAGCWQDGVRSALAAVLSYFDREPQLARVCIVETLAGGAVVLAHRERLIHAFLLPVLQRIEGEVTNVSPLAAEGVMSSVLGIMHAHIVTAKPGPFIEMLGPLMGLTMAPYLGARGVEREIEQGDEVARTILAGGSRWSPPVQSSEQDTGYGAEQATALPAIVGNPGARRARECLLFLLEHPDASNREVAEGIDIVHQSQISRLLSYLAQEKLVTKRSEGAGKRNAWRLTPHGEEIARTLAE